MRGAGFEPARGYPYAPQTYVSTSSTIPAHGNMLVLRAAGVLLLLGLALSSRSAFLLGRHSSRRLLLLDLLWRPSRRGRLTRNYASSWSHLPCPGGHVLPSSSRSRWLHRPTAWKLTGWSLAYRESPSWKLSRLRLRLPRLFCPLFPDDAIYDALFSSHRGPCSEYSKGHGTDHECGTQHSGGPAQERRSASPAENRLAATSPPKGSGEPTSLA